MNAQTKSPITKRFAVAASVALLAGAAAADDLAARVKADFADYGAKPFVHYAVPPMSEVQRLADTYPHDGVPNGPVKIFAAKGEYEAGAFCVWGVEDLGKVAFAVGELKSAEGRTFPTDKLDLKVVKCWYQNLNAWFSYFGDRGDWKLCSELLLNDEDLIRTDEKTKANYARVRDEKGNVRELWINAPADMDLRESRFNGRNPTGAFNPMAPGFDDAPTLQPVAIGKDAFRCFFLTAHVTPDVPAGVYRGAVTANGAKGDVATCAIPVEIHVANYVLPHPKCYREPERDFYVTFYHYNTLNTLRDENGGDMELAVKQMDFMLRDMAAHGQNIHPWCGVLVNELCVKNGMRPDVFFDGPLPYDKTPEARIAHCMRYVNEYDRRFGCHNLYNGWGDEPGCAVNDGFMNELAKFCAEWHSVGMKHFIAARDNLFRQVGFAADWVNIAEEPTRSHPHLEMWNALPGKRCAWYAMQHVGCENPCLARRQNGLASWLSGYTAFANYAHHLGPYNDESGYYKPMVYAYGAHNGMIDTLAWEGFREGIDDIRYATLLAELARKAAADKTVETQLVGQRALHFLALVEKQTADLDTVRAEMRRHVDALLAVVAQDPVEPLKRLPPKPEAAEAALAKDLAPLQAKLAAAKPNERGRVRGEMAKVYRKYFRTEELADFLEKEGDLLGAAQAAYDTWQFDRARTLRERVLNDPQASADARADAAWCFAFERPEIWRDTNVVALLERRVGSHGWGQWQPLGDWMHFGPRHCEGLAAAYRLYAAYDDRQKKKCNMTDAAFEQGVATFRLCGDFAGVNDVVARRLANPSLKPAARYKARLYAKLFGADVQGGKAAVAVLAAYEKAHLTKDVTTDQRVAAINDCGHLALLLGDNDMARGLEHYRAGLFKETPRKRYVVRFSEKPIEGVDWTDIGAEVTLCDRKFGGSKELLETDVATGNRSAAAAPAAEGAQPMKLQIAADAWGLHVRLESSDPKADDVAAGGDGGGSIESYLAPGKNKPYVTLSKGDADNKWEIWNSVYDAIGQRRFRDDDANAIRSYTSARDGRIVNMISVSWDLYAEDVPQSGSVWDYEVFRWGRGECAWNGSRSIHERSTWGELVFELAPSERAKILRRVERRAYARFLREVNGGYFHLGYAKIWLDPNAGDPAFYAARVKPWTEPLLTAGKALAESTDDETVFRLEADGTLSKWHNVKQHVDRLRRAWLER